MSLLVCLFFFKLITHYCVRISDLSSNVSSSVLRHRLPYVHVSVVSVNAGFGHLIRLPIVDSRRAASSTGRAVGCVWTLPASRCYQAGPWACACPGNRGGLP